MHILLKDGVTYELHDYKNEEELQALVFKHWEKIFGRGTLIFPGERIGVPRGHKGASGIPDFFVLDVKNNNWYIIEVELKDHDPDDHIIPQVTKFIRGWKKPESMNELRKRISTTIESRGTYYDIFKEYVGDAEIFRFVSDVLEKKPTLVVIADEVSPDVKEACEQISTMNHEFIDFQTYRRENVADLVPIFKMTKISTEEDGKKRRKGDKPAKERAKPFAGVSTLTFLDNSVPISHAKEINAIVANELIKRHQLTDDKIPWGVGRKRHYIARTPVHPTGAKFRAPIQLSNSWWVETHASKKRTLDLAKKLLKHCGVEKPTVELKETKSLSQF